MSSFTAQILDSKKQLLHKRDLILLSAVIGIILFGVLLGTSVLTPTVVETHFSEHEEIPQTTHQADLIYSESATVTENTNLYSSGDVLEDQSVYHNTATDFAVEIIPVTQQATVTDMTVDMKYVGVERSDTTSVVWERQNQNAQISETEDGIELSLDMENVREDVLEYREVYGDEVLVQPLIETTVSYEYTTYDGSTETAEYTSTGRISLLESGYEVNYDSTQDVQTSGGTSTEPDGFTQNTLFIGGVIFLLGLISATEYVSRTETAQALDEKLKAVRYDEWITSVESYQSTTSNIILTETLEDLVQLAIDIRGRVIYVKQTDEYFVIDNQTVYGYSEHVEAGQPPLSASFGIKYGDQVVRDPTQDQLQNSAEFGFEINSTPEREEDSDQFDFIDQPESPEEDSSNDSSNSSTDTESTDNSDNSNNSEKDDSDDPFGGWRN